MRLWAVHLEITYQRGSTTIAEPQIIIEADGADAAQQIATEWFRADNQSSTPLPVEIVVRSVVEIDQENIWIFNDYRFRFSPSETDQKESDSA